MFVNQDTLICPERRLFFTSLKKREIKNAWEKLGENFILKFQHLLNTQMRNSYLCKAKHFHTKY